MSRIAGMNRLTSIEITFASAKIQSGSVAMI
jgi:hypothetical protein